jgi:hypothetical protein
LSKTPIKLWRKKIFDWTEEANKMTLEIGWTKKMMFSIRTKTNKEHDNNVRFCYVTMQLKNAPLIGCGRRAF